MEIFTIETIFVYLSSNVTRSWNIIKICIKVKRHTHTLSLSLIFTRITDRFIQLSSEGIIRKKAERLIAVGTQWHTFAYTYAFRTVQRFNSHELVPLLYSPISPRTGLLPSITGRSKINFAPLVLLLAVCWKERIDPFVPFPLRCALPF